MAAERNPLQVYLGVQRIYDRNLARILIDAADEAGRLVEKLAPKVGVGAAADRTRLRAMQADLRRQSGDYWQDVRHLTGDSYARAAVGAAEVTSDADRTLFNRAGVVIPEYHAAVMYQAIDNVPTLIARGVNGVPLARSVYGTKNLADGWVDRTVNRGILLGKSAKQIARDVRHLIRPDVRGGVSYAAYRLGRTELNNAFHRTHIDLNGREPWVLGMKWHLSGSHPRADDCDAYADDSHYTGGAPGVFRPEQVPNKPHPQCLCFLSTVQESEDAFMMKLLDGQYDRHLDEVISGAPLPLSAQASWSERRANLTPNVSKVTRIRR